MITTVMAGISVCQIVPIEAEESTYTASVEEDTGTLQVEASAPDDVLPSDAQLVVSPIVNDGTNSLYEDTLNKLNEQASKDKKVIDAFCAYDIQFEDNDAGVEPDDGFVSVSMKWDTALKPDSVQDDDQVSIIHLTSDDKIENLTDETDTDKNHGTVKMDDTDPEAVTEASIISDSFSVYALVWQRDDISSVNVHYIDESGNEIADTNTTDITQETGTDTLVQAIDGYTYAYASIDNTNVQSVNIDNGRLYFYDGTNWNQASSDDVYLTYTVIPAEEVTEPESTPTSEVTEQPEETEAPVTPETTPEPEQNTDKQLTGSTTDGKYNVTVTYGDDAGLPEGTSLSVKQIDEDNEEYADAKKAVSTATGVDTDDLGMAALDITLLDKDGNKVEPEDNSKVKVSITAEDLPDSVNSVDIHHITENENSSSDTGLLSKIAGLFKSNDKDTAETVKKNVTVTNGQAVTDFEVSSFSTFTITWTTTKPADTGDQKYRIASVTVRYVDENGLNLDTQEEFTPEEKEQWSQNENGIVDLSEWANKADGSSRVKGYTYDHATLRSRDGQVITGLKAVKENSTLKTRTGYDEATGQYTYQDVSATIYRLYYTTDQTINKTDANANTWTEFTDYGTNTYANNSFVYLVYKKIEKPVTIHFLNTSGNTIKDSDGNDLTKVIDAADHTTEYDLVEYAKANIPSGYSFSESSLNSNTAGTNKIIVGDNKGEVTIGSVKGTYNRFMKYEDGSVKFRRGNTSLQAVSDPVNIYITFTKNTNDNDPSAVTIHHVDQYGAMLAADTTDTFGFTINGSSNISSAFTNRWNGSSKNNQSGKSYFEQKAVDNVGTYQKAYIGKFNEESNLGTDGLFFKKTSSTGSWQTGTGTMGTDGVSVTTEIKVDGQSGLYTDVYDVYSGKKGLTIHYVDEDGKEIRTTGANAADSGATFNPASSSVDGYTYKEAHIGSFEGQLFTAITFNKSSLDDTWTSSVKNGDEDVTTDQNPVNEVWLVYTKGVNSKKITLHYQYVNKSGSYSDAYYGNDTNNKTVSVDVTSGARNYLVTNPIDGSYVENIKDGSVFRPAGDGETGAQPLQFMSSHLAGADGPTVASVDLTSDGTLIYHTSMSGTADPDDNSANPVSWTFSEPSGEQKGRSVSIRKDSNGYLYLIDSLTGDIPLNLVNDEADGGSTDSRIGETYKGTLQNATTDVDYVVTVDYFDRTDSDGTVTRIPRYGIEVTNSYPSTSTDVYQVYIDGKSSDDKIWIEDDMKYTGLFRLDASEGLKTKLNEADDKNAVVEWHRLTVNDTDKDKIPTTIDSSTTMPKEVTDEVVYRKISGEHWNLALNANERTWLDIEADEGDDVWRKGTTHAYYAKVTYTPKNASETQTLYTTPLTVNYYGQLENGSFEDPTISTSNKQFSNSDYKENGVWQTTGPGITRSEQYRNDDIEIISGTNHERLKSDYNWQPTSEENSNSTGSWAAEGNQFAELNAENAGALYQDVITHPNEKINYWLSHRARGNTEDKGAVKKYAYDTMYVVIMPTKLAMTMGDNGTELRTQDELKHFISTHGGFDSSVPVQTGSSNSSDLNEATMTYYDEDAGIMIYKIRSSEFEWHNVAINNQYTAKGGLTRFFFAAASTAGDTDRGERHTEYKDAPPTMGNFIDNVGFNQSLPPTTGFNLTVTETFSGITMEQLAGLASNASDYTAAGITAQAHPLQVTLTNTRTTNVSGGTTTPNDALNGAKLGFSMGYDNDGNLVLTPTAIAGNGTTDLLSTDAVKPGSSEIRQYPDGRIVITWKFPDQLLQVGNDSTTDATYRYTANDNLVEGGNTSSSTDISGMAKTTSQNAVVVVDGKRTTDPSSSSATAGSISSLVSTGSDKTLNIINVYSPNVHISVRKTFEGVTPTTVNEMMNGTGNSQPYSITITKTDDSNAVKILKADGGYLSDGTKDNTVSVSSSTGSDGSTTYKWTITDPSWSDATYNVQESNYTTSRNTLAKVTVNGNEVTLGSDQSWPGESPSVTVNSTDAANINFQATYSGRTDENKGVIDLSKIGGVLPDTSMNSNPTTNLVVGQYTLKTSETTGEGSETASSISVKKYIVWTSAEVGLTSRNAIINEINSIWGETNDSDKASLENTSFYTGDNAYVVSDGRTARMVNRESASLGSVNSTDTWDKFYAGHMSAASNSSFTDESEIRIENEYTPLIRIQKQSSETTTENGNETHERLNGAEFRLYKKDDNSKLYYQGNGKWDASEDTAKKFTTSGEGENKGLVNLDSLPIDGNTIYYLEEYKAPDGYNKISDISFKVRANGTVGLVNESGVDQSTSETDKVQVTFIDPYYTLNVANSPGSILPITGGKGIALFTMMGMLLIAIAGVLYAKKKVNQNIKNLQ